MRVETLLMLSMTKRKILFLRKPVQQAEIQVCSKESVSLQILMDKENSNPLKYKRVKRVLTKTPTKVLTR
jgi:hypothetical protein